MNKTYLFYDIETTGLNKCFDQVVQFAAIRTDLHCNELSRHEIMVRLNRDIIPSPEAFITHRVTLQDCQQGISEYEAMQEIHALFNTPNTISLGYNTLGFDDEFLRFSFYRNLLPPYTHQFANQCSRADLYPVAVLFFLFQNDALNWPEENGKVNLKLENLNKSNGLATGPSHNAMNDVEATIALAKKFIQFPEIWKYAMSSFDKQTDQERIAKLQQDMALVINGYLGFHNNFQAPALNLGQHAYYRNQSLWLRLDSPSLQTTTFDNIAETTSVFRKKIAEEVLVLPSHERFLKKIDAERLKISNENRLWLNNNKEIFDKIRHYHQHFQYPKIENIDIDAGLYQLDFPSPQEEFLFRQFHQATPQNKMAIAKKISNPTRRLLGMRIIARHYPEFLFDEVPFEFNSNCIDFKGNAKLTSLKALSSILNLRSNKALDNQQLAILDELELHLQTVNKGTL